MDVIVVENMSKGYRGRPLYRDVSFRIGRGDVVHLSGPNGSGKSVLLRMMCGFTKPDSGVITINEKYLSRGRTFPEKFGIVIDRPGYLAGQTGLSNLLELARIRNQIDESRVRETMIRVGLDPDIRQKVGNYSLGMKQKLGLAQALMEHPEVLILDEPFNALDVASAAALKDILLEFISSGGTLVYTSHDSSDLSSVRTHLLEIVELTVRHKAT